MAINWQTEKKISEIKELLSLGYSPKDILQKKFNRSVQKLKEHLEENKNYYSLEEQEILLGLKPDSINLVKVEHDHIPTIFQDKNNIQALELLLKNSSKLLKLLENSELENNTLNHLDIPKDFLKEDSIKVKSFRVSKDIDLAFDKFCLDYSEYNKTELFNYALLEFMNKYKK